MGIRLAVVCLLAVACGPGALTYTHPETGRTIKCDGGGAFAAWEREQRRRLCVESAIAGGYVIDGD